MSDYFQQIQDKLQDYADDNGYGLEDIKLRISSRFIPDYTFDMSKEDTLAEGAKAGKSALTSILKPKAIVHIPKLDQTLELDVDSQTIKQADAKIFDTPTALDQLKNVGFIPAGFGLIVLLLVGRKLGKKLL